MINNHEKLIIKPTPGNLGNNLNADLAALKKIKGFLYPFSDYLITTLRDILKT